MVGNKSWRGWRPLWRWGWARRRRGRGRRWRRRRLRWGAWATEPAPTAFAVGAVLYGELAYAPRLAHSMMRVPLRRRGAEGWRRGRRRIGRRPWRPAHRASASRAALAFAKLPCVSGKNPRVTSSKAERATQSTQRNAEHKGGKVEPMHGCGLWRTVQCCACSLSALHQLLHCSMELSCGFAGLQLTGADLGEAELRAWVPTSMASPQAARNVKAGA